MGCVVKFPELNSSAAATLPVRSLSDVKRLFYSHIDEIFSDIAAHRATQDDAVANLKALVDELIDLADAGV